MYFFREGGGGGGSCLMIAHFKWLFDLQEESFKKMNAFVLVLAADTHTFSIIIANVGFLLGSGYHDKTDSLHKSGERCS